MSQKSLEAYQAAEEARLKHFNGWLHKNDLTLDKDFFIVDNEGNRFPTISKFYTHKISKKPSKKWKKK